MSDLDARSPTLRKELGSYLYSKRLRSAVVGCITVLCIHEKFAKSVSVMNAFTWKG